MAELKRTYDALKRKLFVAYLVTFRRIATTLGRRIGIQMSGQKHTNWGARMGRFWVNTVLGMTVGSFVLAGMVDGQAIQASVTSPTNSPSTNNAVNPRNSSAEVPSSNPNDGSVQPAEESAETTLDPASLL